MIILFAHLKVYQHKGTRSSWLAGARTPNRTPSIFQAPEVTKADESSDDDEDGYDGEESVAGTETTDASESNSLGSLTSVD